MSFGRSRLARRKGKGHSGRFRRLTLEQLECRRALTIAGTVFLDEIFPAGNRDEHHFVITEQNLASAGGEYVVTLSLSSGVGQFQPHAKLFSPSQSPLGGEVLPGAKTRYWLREPGVYVVQVRDNDDRDTGNYALSLEGLNPPSANAVAIELGDVKQGVLAAGGVNAYVFTAAAGDIIAIALAETDVSSEGYHPRAELYHSASGERIAMTSMTTGGSVREFSSGRKYVSPPLARSGTYVIQVFDNNYTDSHPNGYYLALEGLNPASADAEWIAPGDVKSGQIEVGEIDTYRFTGTAGDLITVSLSDDAPGLTTQLWAQLFAPSGEPVRKLAGTPGFHEVKNGGRVIYRLPETATIANPYILQVYDNNYTDSEAYGVALVGLNPPSPNAPLLAYGQARTGTLDVMGQVDAYRFTLTANDLALAGGSYPVRLSFDSEETSAYKPRAVLFSPAGRELDDVGAGKSKLLSLTEIGTYVVQVHDDDFTHTKQEVINRGKSPVYSLQLHDALAPKVQNVTVSNALLSDAHVGSRLAMTVVFSESMQTATKPAMVFSPNIASGVSATLINPSAGVWSQTQVPDDTFTIDYEIADRNVEINSVLVGVSGARDLAGNLQQSYTPQHALRIDTWNPTVTARSPANNATRVPWDANLTLTFREPIQIGSGNVTLRKVSDGSTVETIAVGSPQVTIAGAKTTIARQIPLEENTRYYVEIPGGAFRDLVGNPAAPIQGATGWSFTSVSIPGLHAPFVARPLPDLTFMLGAAGYEVDLSRVFDDLDLPDGDVLTIAYDGAVDNTNAGLLSAELDGEILKITLTDGAVGEAHLTVNCTDLAGQTTSDTFTVRIVAAPIANDDHVTTDRNIPVEIAVYANDTDADGWVEPHTVTIVPGSGPASGQIALDRGVVTYTPGPNFAGTDSFRYTLRDNDGFFSNQATVTITVNAVPVFHNAALPGDVNNSGHVTPHDALIVINYINTVGFQLPPAPLPPAKPAYYYDVNGDDAVTPLDVLAIINLLNNTASGSAEGEAAVGSLARAFPSRSPGGEQPAADAQHPRASRPLARDAAEQTRGDAPRPSTSRVARSVFSAERTPDWFESDLTDELLTDLALDALQAPLAM